MGDAAIGSLSASFVHLADSLNYCTEHGMHALSGLGEPGGCSKVTNCWTSAASFTELRPGNLLHLQRGWSSLLGPSATLDARRRPRGGWRSPLCQVHEGRHAARRLFTRHSNSTLIP